MSDELKKIGDILYYADIKENAAIKCRIIGIIEAKNILRYIIVTDERRNCYNSDSYREFLSHAEETYLGRLEFYSNSKLIQVDKLKKYRYYDNNEEAKLCIQNNLVDKIKTISDK